MVHGYGGAKGADTETTDETADGELDPGLEGGDLDEDADHEDAALDSHGVATSEVVGDTTARVSYRGSARKKGVTHGAPMRAPTRVPILRRETMRPSRTVVNEHVLATPGVEQSAKRRRKSSMTRISEI